MSTGFDLSRLSGYPSLGKVVGSLLNVWPQHAAYCNSRFRDDPPEFMQRSDELAGLALRLMGDDSERYYKNYRWMCEEFLKEEFFFRREGRYRLSSFAEAYEEVYGNPSYMARYVNGILISQLIWTPHARAFDFFRTDFLPRIPRGARHLEIGPGHGLFLYFAARVPGISALEAWDVSRSSIEATQRALLKLGVSTPIAIKEQDILLAPQRSCEFESAIISEVLEHLERPDAALKTLHQALVPTGRLFINVPINSPAPDHIYLWSTTDEIVELVKAAGFEIEATQFLPMTGHSLERAVKHKLSISCIVIARRPI